MKLIVLLIFSSFSSLFFTLPAWGLQNVDFKTQIGLSLQGEYIQALKIQCQPQSSFCFELCKNTEHCLFEEPPCLNCASTAVPLLNLIFSLDNNFELINSKSIPILSPSEIFNFLKNYKGTHVFLSTMSVYNYASSWNSEQLLKKFHQLCNSKNIEKSPILLASINAQSEIQNVESVICPE